MVSQHIHSIQCIDNNNFLFPYKYIYRYRKPISSNRLINYHSVIPAHEIINTYTMRVVNASRYDSGGSFLKSYHIIFNEMYDNSLPRRIMRQCFIRSLRYALGRSSYSKQIWCRFLSKHIYEIVITPSYDDFVIRLHIVAERHDYDSDLFVFIDDVHPYPIPKTIKPVYHEPGAPLVKITYRGRRSQVLYQHLRRHYKRCTAVYQHDRYFGMRRLCQKGIILKPIDERVKKLLMSV